MFDSTNVNLKIRELMFNSTNVNLRIRELMFNNTNVNLKIFELMFDDTNVNLIIMKTMKENRMEAFTPIRSLQELIAAPETPTGSILLDAVMKVMVTTHARNTKQIADHLKVDRVKLSGAIELLTGSSLQVILEAYCIQNVEYQLKDTDLPLLEIVRQNGFTSTAALTHFFQRFHDSVTPLEYRSGRRRIR